MSSNQSGEGEIRKAIVEADLVDCMVALPGQLFYSTQIPVCLWFLARGRQNGRFRDRRGHTLFIDARKLGTMVDRVHRELTTETFSTARVVVVPPSLLRVFEGRVAPILQRVLENVSESRTLAALRDALLPKLISGELRVGANKSLASEAA